MELALAREEGRGQVRGGTDFPCAVLKLQLRHGEPQIRLT